MTAAKVAILGGDRRELRIAARLRERGHPVSLFGAGPDAATTADSAATAVDAVRDAQWVVCPSPGLGTGDVVYAPSAAAPIVLDRALLAASDASRGGLMLGRATPTLARLAAELGIPVHEMKDERGLAVSNATAVAEALLRLLIERTDQVLQDYPIMVLGYGATGSALVDRLLGMRCRPTVAARRSEALQRIRQCGAEPVAFEQRAEAMARARIVVNTVPATESIPPEAFPVLAHRLVIDIASPPGGMDHEAAARVGLPAIWARGLAGARAPISAGDAQFDFLVRAMAGHTEIPELPPAQRHEPLVPPISPLSTT